MLGHQRESMPKTTHPFLAGGSNHTRHEEYAGPQTWLIISLGPANMPKCNTVVSLYFLKLSIASPHATLKVPGIRSCK